MNEEGTLVAMRVEGPAGRYVVPGSEIRRCDRCGAEVIVAPSSVEILKTKRLEIACMECVSVEELGAGKVEMPADRQKEEIAEGGGRGPRNEEEAKQWFRDWKRRGWGD